MLVVVKEYIKVVKETVKELESIKVKKYQPYLEVLIPEQKEYVKNLTKITKRTNENFSEDLFEVCSKYFTFINEKISAKGSDDPVDHYNELFKNKMFITMNKFLEHEHILKFSPFIQELSKRPNENYISMMQNTTYGTKALAHLDSGQDIDQHLKVLALREGDLNHTLKKEDDITREVDFTYEVFLWGVFTQNAHEKYKRKLKQEQGEIDLANKVNKIFNNSEKAQEVFDEGMKYASRIWNNITIERRRGRRPMISVEKGLEKPLSKVKKRPN